MDQETPAGDGGEGMSLAEAAAAIRELPEEEEERVEAASGPEPESPPHPPAADGGPFPRIESGASSLPQAGEGTQARVLAALLQQAAQGKYAGVDWVKLSRENPSGYVQLRAQYEADIQRLAAVQAEHGRRTHAHVAEQSAKLHAALPDLADREKGGRLRKELSDYLTGLGFSREEVGGVSDHRAVVVAHKAMLYDRAQKARTNARAQIDTGLVQRPGARSGHSARAQDAQDAISKLRRSGRLGDAAAVIRKLGIGT